MCWNSQSDKNYLWNKLNICRINLLFQVKLMMNIFSRLTPTKSNETHLTLVFHEFQSLKKCTIKPFDSGHPSDFWKVSTTERCPL